MDTINALFINIGKKLPSQVINHWQSKLVYAGSEKDAGVWLASRIFMSSLFALVAALFVLNFFNGLLSIFTFFIALLALLFFSYLQLYFAVLERAAKMEKMLPDFLMLIVSNLHAGMTPFDAFVKAARPEFGPLYDDVLRAGAKVGGKRSLEHAMVDLAGRFDSEIFRKTIELFLRATRAGGSIAKLLTANAEEIRKIQDLRAELISTTRQQAILLGFIVAVLMPFLLGIGYNFLVVFISIKEQLTSIGSGQTLPTATLFTYDITITPQEMFNISIVTLVITNFLVSLFIGIVRYGKALYGLRYFLQILIVSLLLFIMTQNSLQGITKVL